MKHFRMGISLLSLAALVSNGIAPAIAAPPAGYEDDVIIHTGWFSDVDPTSRIGIAANYLADEGIVGGFPDGTFRPDQLVNRAEMAKFITLADKNCIVGNEKNNGRFRDLIEGEWYVPYVIAAANCGIITGNPDGTFAPQRNINTVEFLAMIARAQFGYGVAVYNTYTDVEESSWYSNYAGIAQKAEIFPDRKNELFPARFLTRGEVAYALYMILKGENIPLPPLLRPIHIGADLSIKLEHEAKVGPNDDVNYTVTVYNAGPQRAEDISFRHSGLTNNMFKRTFDTQPSIENKSESLSLAPGKSYTFNISFPSPSNVGCASYYIHKVSVKSKTYDPIRKNNSFTSNGPRVVCDDEADISVDMTGPNSVAQGDLVTYSLTVRNDGPNDATNVFLSSLYNNPQLRFKEAMGVSCLADTDGITVRCGPFDLLAGDEGRLITLIFETPENMRCDIPIINSASVQTFDQRDPDLGNNRSRSVHTTVECDPEPASLKVTVKHIGTEDVAVVGQKNINLLRFEATTGEADDILLIAARFRAQEGQTSNIQNYSLWADTDDDGEVDTILEDGVSHNVVAGVGITVEFNSLAGGGYVVPAEQTAVFEVHGDVASSLGEIPSLRLRFMTEGNYVEAEELDSGTSIEGISLNAVPSILWRFVTQLEPVSLSVTVKDIGTEDVAVAGQKNINLFRLEARAGTEDLLLTRARFIANEGETTNVQNYTLWVDTDHNGVVDIILERGVSSMIGVIEFDGLAGGGYVIPAGNKAVFEVHGDVASSLSPNPTLRLQFMEQGEYLNAEGLDDGTALVGIETNGSCNGINECQISVTTQDSILWKFM